MNIQDIEARCKLLTKVRGPGVACIYCEHIRWCSWSVIHNMGRNQKSVDIYYAIDLTIIQL